MTSYYNEIDPKCCNVLRRQIANEGTSMKLLTRLILIAALLYLLIRWRMAVYEARRLRHELKLSQALEANCHRIIAEQHAILVALRKHKPPIHLPLIVRTDRPVITGTLFRN